jgi:hypothetical protein
MAIISDESVTHTNEKGGRQSYIKVAYVLMDSYAMNQMAQVLWHGANKYGVDNWKLIHSKDHVNHAMNHIFLWLAGDKTENHLVNAFTRLMFAVAMEKQEQEHGR